MLRILILVLALAGCLTSPVFATTERGDHLFEEGLCDLDVNRPDFVQFLFEVLRNHKVLTQ